MQEKQLSPGLRVINLCLLSASPPGTICRSGSQLPAWLGLLSSRCPSDAGLGSGRSWGPGLQVPIRAPPVRMTDSRSPP